MIKKLLLVVFLLSVCTGCGLRNMGNPQALIMRDAVVREGNSIVRMTNGTREVLLEVAKEFKPNPDEDGGFKWRFESETAFLGVMDYFGVSEQRATVMPTNKYYNLSSLESYYPVSKIIDENREYSIWLIRGGGDEYIYYQYVERKEMAEGWRNYRISYWEELPPELRRKVWNASFDFGGTYLDDFIKRAHASFTIRSF
ncbi:hypothetical protein [Desulfovibrio subterraneus]|uniref:Lipoprotein n=1 Tax=Desulfovibrio subterraneus TaxID=2718620 RepID=A0A7J0BMB5_9BACT|nr:hypothetical protein [Desulfovibrio subterraneus]GFM34184.1 hypothetical protein DSM101010T_25490 [Desulfovibrio subterraneus]